MKIMIEKNLVVDFDNLPMPEQETGKGILIVQGSELSGMFRLPFSAAQRALVINPFASQSPLQLEILISTEYLPEDYIYSSKDGQSWSRTALQNLKNITKDLSFLLLPGKHVDSTLENFQEIIAQLRSPDGCPWDKKQTHTSLRPYLLEETYEALDALDRGDWNSLKEELGDLLLQIALHAQIAQENMEFRMADVLTGINRKIVFRHPHVFKDWNVDGEHQVVQNWETLKVQEREENGNVKESGLLDGVPSSYPALAQAQAIQERAARVGFDWKEIDPVLEKVQEELEEIRTARNDKERTDEFGDLLFSLVNLIRWNKIDAESALRQTNKKFRKRFAFLESKAKEEGRQLNQMSLDEMDKLWEEAKRFDE